MYGTDSTSTLPMIDTTSNNVTQETMEPRESPPESTTIVRKPISPETADVTSDQSPRATPNRTNSTSSAHHSTAGSATSPIMLKPLQTQSPNTLNQQLPPSCGAKQLAKLKRFLTTLQKFGSDISPEIGERVRTLVLALVNSQMSIEDFHSKLQETTNFPLKPFVVPFLKAALPVLQQELHQCAQVARQSPQQYLANNERVIFDAGSVDKISKQGVPSPLVKTDASPRHKRKPSLSQSDGTPAKKQPHTNLTCKIPNSTPSDKNLVSATDSRFSPPEIPFYTNQSSVLPAPAPIKLSDISRLSRARLEDVDTRLFGSQLRTPIAPDINLNERNSPESWDNIQTMLNCITSMVEKTKTALNTLKENKARETQELTLLMKKHAEGVDKDLKKRTGEMMSQTLRQTEDRITEIKRQADEMVNDVKRQAILEIHHAITAAELKANEHVNQERVKMERLVQQIKHSAKEEALKNIDVQSDTQENCWNCGRRASETCSGCNKARYCGQFCQHKDWDRHHLSCGSGKNDSENTDKVVEKDRDEVSRDIEPKIDKKSSK